MPGARKGASILQSLSPTEAVLFAFFGLLLIVGALGVIRQINHAFLEEVPIAGGTLTEGIVGTPRFINPLLSFSSSDKDLTALVYAGLVKKDPQGEIVPELAESYEISEDGRTYTFTLREDALFHDGVSVTADDVVFTVKTVQNDRLQSPKRANWSGISVEKIDDRTVAFTLEEPFAPFLETASIGILPAHLWQDLEVEQIPFSGRNIEPIGAGPYAVEEISRIEGGIPGSYFLRSFEEYVGGAPYVSKIILQIYESEESLLKGYGKGEVGAVAGVSAKNIEAMKVNNLEPETAPLSRIFSIFFNQNSAPIFTDIYLRRALERSVDKDLIIKEVFKGFATQVDNPFPPQFLPQGSSDPNNSNNQSQRESEARKILEEGEWEFDVEKGVWTKEDDNDIKEATFTLTTGDVPELVQVAKLISSQWEKIGVKTELQILDGENLRDSSIRPREYEALLFGQIVSRPVDLYAFWHSSQRSDPGLNVSLYTNVETDSILSELRSERDQNNIESLISALGNEIKEDVPAIPLYMPDLIYFLPEKVKGVRLSLLKDSSERFSNVSDWFMETNKQWIIFESNN